MRSNPSRSSASVITNGGATCSMLWQARRGDSANVANQFSRMMKTWLFLRRTPRAAKQMSGERCGAPVAEEAYDALVQHRPLKRQNFVVARATSLQRRKTISCI
jgi:hypothetical protein